MTFIHLKTTMGHATVVMILQRVNYGANVVNEDKVYMAELILRETTAFLSAVVVKEEAKSTL